MITTASDAASAKFNLVGPDMVASEWKQALDGLAGRLVFVNTTSSSFPFVQALAGKNRVVIAATDSTAQRYDTVFPEYFIRAPDQGTKADGDKNGRLSVWEVFACEPGRSRTTKGDATDAQYRRQ